jgi:hypothetical protein
MVSVNGLMVVMRRRMMVMIVVLGIIMGMICRALVNDGERMIMWGTATTGWWWRDRDG